MSTYPSKISHNDDPFWSHRAWACIAAALLFLCTVVVALTFLDYGVTYDENWRLTYGKYVVDWYLSGFKDTSALNFWALSLQGGFTSALGYLAGSVSPIGRYETAHLVNALFGLLGLIGVYKLGVLLGCRFVGLLAAVVLAFTPRYYGDMFNNFSDVPMASLSAFSLYYLVRLMWSLPHVPRGLVLKLGAVIGLALAVRTAAIILVASVGIGLSLWFLHEWLSSRRSLRNALSSSLPGMTIAFAGVCVTAYLVMLLWWPAAQLRPFYQPAKGLWWASHFDYDIEVLFEGTVWSNKDVPWYYLPKWFLITLPEFYFLGLGAGLILLAFARRSRLSANLALALAVTSILSLLPLLHCALTAPPQHDGIRHFLFVLPGLAVLAAYSFAEVVKRGRLWRRISLLALFIASLLFTGIAMVRLHPYQYVYFNHVFAGGLKAADGSYETDYWGASYKEGVEWLVAHYPLTPGHKPKVASCLHPFSTSYFLPPDRFEFIGSVNYDPLPARPDILLASTRWSCHKKETGRVLHTVSRMGVPLLFVIEVNPSIREMSSLVSDGQR